MMKRSKTYFLTFIVLALLMAPFSMSVLAGAAEAEAAADDAEVALTTDDVQPIDVPETDAGIMAISAEIDPDSDLASTVDLGGEVVPFESMIYKVMQANNHWIVIVGGTLPETATLPATIEVAVPTGSPVFWFGEVGESGDPALDPRFPDDRRSMRTVGDLDVYTAVMTTYRDMQIEYRLNHNPFSQGPDGPTISLEYTPWHDVSELRLAAALPPGAAVLARDVEFIGFGPGETPDQRSAAFARIFNNVNAGETFSTEITYTITGGGSAQSGVSPVLVGALIAGTIVVAGVVFFIFARSTKKRHEEDDYYEDDGDIEDSDEGEGDAEEYADEDYEDDYDEDGEQDADVSDDEDGAGPDGPITRH